MTDELLLELAAAAAPWVVDHGLDYEEAKRKAAQQLGCGRGAPRPSHLQVEAAVREHLELFHADTQPEELAQLRRLALRWMARLAPFRPHLAGAAWRGTATRHSPLLIELYTDDPKAVEIELINQGVPFDTAERRVAGRREPIPLLGLQVPSREWGHTVPVEISVMNHDDLRGALLPDEQGQSWRGSLDRLQALMEAP